MDRGFCSFLIHLLVAGLSLNIGALVSDCDSVNVDLSSVILSGATVLMILQHFVNVFECTACLFLCVCLFVPVWLHACNSACVAFS